MASRATLDTAITALLAVEVDTLDDEGVRDVLAATQRAIDRLSGLRATLAGALEQRAIAAAPPGREQGALRVVRDRTAKDLRLTPGEAKRAGETGRRLADHPEAAAAMTGGRLPAEHARVLADTLRWLEPDARTVAESTLLQAAHAQNATTFGRTCRRLLAETDHEAAQVAQERRNARRSLRVTQTPDGMIALHGQGSGLSGEIVQTALHAFRHHDATTRNQPADQAMWDALERVCRVALDTGEASSNRNVRPHVLITVPEPVVADHDGRGVGVATTAWSGPLPWTEVRPVLADCDVSRVLVDAAGLPLEAGEAVRTVPAGLWKALQVRDGTCIGDRCTQPAAWCQVMHLEVSYRLGGRLALDTAAPGCSYHHRMLDHHGWQVTWIAGRPVLHHPDRPPKDPLARSREPTPDAPRVPRRSGAGRPRRSRSDGSHRQPSLDDGDVARPLAGGVSDVCLRPAEPSAQLARSP